MVKNCGYCSNNGFCLNRLTVINQQGVCKYLTKPGWDQKIDPKWFNTNIPSIQQQDNKKLIETNEIGKDKE